MVAICANIGSPPFSPISISTSAAAIMPDVSLGVRIERTQFEQMSSGLPRETDITRRSRHVAHVPIVLQKSFCLTVHKFSGL
jgi:hypothetical protein